MRVRIPVVMTTIQEHETELEAENLGITKKGIQDVYWWIYQDTEESYIWVDPKQVILIQNVTDGFSRIYIAELTSFICPRTADELNEIL